MAMVSYGQFDKSEQEQEWELIYHQAAGSDEQCYYAVRQQAQMLIECAAGMIDEQIIMRGFQILEACAARENEAIRAAALTTLA